MNQTVLPLILRQAVPLQNTQWHDLQTDTDPLGAIVTTNADGTINAGTTRLTEVKQETTDDR